VLRRVPDAVPPGRDGYLREPARPGLSRELWPPARVTTLASGHVAPDGGAARRPRARGAHAGRPGLVQRRDRRTALPQPGHRENARGAAADQAAGPRPDP